ncbi:hypothetical protein [Candidatus Phyllobacterium onerii]|uniref:hypothetical protein n=1 Tax=Candidatus Phyllobacterium onerii TaxID=3020828 RepID=UPI00232F551F|nr:hypothetical protein [Phyllobacterium sp. IY22]
MVKQIQKMRTAKERRDYHFEEMKRAIVEMHPDLTKWDVDFTDDNRVREPLVLGVVIHAMRPETEKMREARKETWADYEARQRERKAEEAKYRDTVLAKFVEGPRL